MRIEIIESQTTWDDAVSGLQPNTFLHSWAWKQVQEADGEHVDTLGFYEDDRIVAVALVITIHAKRGTQYLVPHGPLLKDVTCLPEVLRQLTAYYTQRSSDDHAVVLRIAPLVELSSEIKALFASLGFRPAPMHVHAELTWVLDIAKSETELLQGMRKTTRHAIIRAQREGVHVEIISDASAVERFWPLYEQTTTRHGFVAFQKQFIVAQAEIFGRNSQMFFAIASYENQDVAAAMLIHYGDTVFYYHGASLKTLSNIPAAQLLQWEAIREAKKRGAKVYNFWGIARDEEPNHPFAGITTFKKGFGGYAIDYLHAQDYVLSWKYWLLWAIETYRKKRRGF